MLKVVNMSEHINKYPHELSGGQQQRVSIARAILRDAPIVVMDEATSALDTATEKTVLANMMKAYPNRTRIITTHRPSMLQYCTRVYRINENGILERVEDAPLDTDAD